MPFPLFAHQAPVLPLKALRPRAFSGTALAIGSLAPDLEYLGAATPRVHGFAHTVVGQFAFCLPATLALVWLVANVVVPALAPRLPPGPRWHLDGLRFVGAAVRGRAGARTWARVAASALVGSFSHIALDGVTHAQGWAPRAWPGVFARTLTIAGREMAVTRCLQYGITVVGAIASVALLAAWLRGGAFARWAAAERTQVAGAPPRGGLAWMALAALAGAAYGARSGRVALAHPEYYFAHGRVHVWGFVLFRAVSFAAAALALACAAARIVDQRARERDPESASRSDR